MSDTAADNLIHSFSDAGITADHPPLVTLPVLVAPSTEDQFNTIRPHLAPIACWSIGDARFEFGSSFVLPEIAEDLRSLAALIRGLESRIGTKPLSTVFGHADPVGEEEFNKKLSGRRAAAVYAMLARRPDIWEDIFSQKAKYTAALSADKWGDSAIDCMLTDLGYHASAASEESGSDDAPDSSDRPTRDEIRSFQRDHGLADDGIVGPKTRDALFRAYMDKHCRSRRREPLILEKEDFLTGSDETGKGDYQGCSEFNPLLVFSSDEHQEYSKPENKAERDEANAPNRRVIVFLFNPALRTEADDWPCPRAKEGTDACRKRLWHNADDRRSLTSEPRTFEEGGDTFTCRFYERLASGSPCERARQTIQLRIRLFDELNKPIPSAPYRLTVRGEPRVDNADDSGFIEHELSFLPRRCQVEWDLPSDEGAPPEEYRYRLDVFLDHYRVEDDEAQMKRRLFNLGYPIVMNKPAEEQQEVIRTFQADCRDRFPELEISGELDEPTVDVLMQVHDECNPVIRDAGSSDDDDDHDHDHNHNELDQVADDDDDFGDS